MKQDCVKFFSLKAVAAHLFLCYQSSPQLFPQQVHQIIYIKSNTIFTCHFSGGFKMHHCWKWRILL